MMLVDTWHPQTVGCIVIRCVVFLPPPTMVSKHRVQTNTAAEKANAESSKIPFTEITLSPSLEMGRKRKVSWKGEEGKVTKARLQKQLLLMKVKSEEKDTRVYDLNFVVAVVCNHTSCSESCKTLMKVITASLKCCKKRF